MYIILFMAITTIVFSIYYWIFGNVIGKKNLKGKAILITGCDSGFGKQMALYCHHQLEMIVIACCHMKNQPDSWKEFHNLGIHVVQNFDITDFQSIKETRRKVDEILLNENLSLWCVVNNAAMLVFGEIEWQTPSQIQNQFQVNTVGPILLAKAMLPLLRKTNGRIINITSSSARYVIPFFTPYAASKTALETLSHGLRLESAKFGVDVILLEPPNVPDKTPLCGRQRKFHQEMHDQMDEENREIFGHYFHQCSKAICSFFPKNSTSGDNFYPLEFIGLFYNALSQTHPRFLYTSKKRSEVILQWIKETFGSVEYHDKIKLNMVPLPKYVDVVVPPKTKIN